jgi:hypothetical protein
VFEESDQSKARSGDNADLDQPPNFERKSYKDERQQETHEADSASHPHA